VDRHQYQRCPQQGLHICGGQVVRLVRKLGMAALAAALAVGCASKPRPVAPPPAQISELSTNTFAAAWRAEVPLRTARMKRLMVDDYNVYIYTNDEQCFWLSRNGGRLMSISTVGDGGEKLYNVISLADRVVVPTSTQLVVYDRKGKLMHTVKLRYPATSGVSGDGRSVFLTATVRLWGAVSNRYR